VEQGGRFQVGMIVGDLDAMVDFYEHLLGFEFLGDLELPNGMMKRFVLGDAGLKLLAPHERPSVPTAPGGPSGGVAGLRYLTVEVPDVAEMVERCAAAGRSVPVPVFEFEPGTTVAIVEDPEGNWVELIQPQ
jgi:catechol 2,3-dioxygenase-like lactoylglutathione lyase family enzyme